MVIPTTGLTFLFGAFVFLYLGRRFYQSYKIERNPTAKLFSYSFLSIGFGYFIGGMTTLFLIDSRTVWRVVDPIYAGFLSGGWTLLAYVVFSNTFPKYSKIFAILLFILFITSVLPFCFNVPRYYYRDGALDWELVLASPLWYLSLITYFTSPFIQISLAVILFRQAKRAVDKKVKIRSLGLGIAICLSFTALIMDFIIITVFKVHPVYDDLNYLLMFSALALALLFTWFPPRSKYVTKIE